jgi:hypothetical protein
VGRISITPTATNFSSIQYCCKVEIVKITNIRQLHIILEKPDESCHIQWKDHFLGVTSTNKNTRYNIPITAK